MPDPISIEDIEKQVSMIEHRTGRWVMSYRVTQDGKVTDIEFADIGPFDDYIISVQSCKPSLCRQTGKLAFEPVDHLIPPELRETYENWLAANVEAQGGSVTRSGVYRWVLGMPKEIADALGIEPEFVIEDDDDEDF